MKRRLGEEKANMGRRKAPEKPKRQGFKKGGVVKIV